MTSGVRRLITIVLWVKRINEGNMIGNTVTKLNNLTEDFITDLHQEIDSIKCGQLLIDLYAKYGAHAANIWTNYNYEGSVTTNYPEQWRKHIYEMGWGEDHHVCQLSKQSMQPITWGVDITPTDPRRNSIGEQVVMTAHDSFLARSAVTFPVHAFNGKQSGGVSFVTNMSRAEFLSLISESMTFLQSVAILTHQRIQFLNEQPDSECSQVLAPRERECIKWLANGNRTNQIADKLGIRDVTVNLYIQNAKKKLRARTREQLIATSIINGHLSI